MMKKSEKSDLANREFIVLMAVMMSLVALVTDAILPALPDMGRDLRVTNVNDSQLVISLLFLGIAFGQFVYGPLSDSTGRKRAMYLGFLVFFIGCFISIFSNTLPIMLTGRFLQGLGLAAPRVLCLALIRDQYTGRSMARVMSFVMVFFILVPMLAPALGQGILLVANWQMIFWVFLLLGVVIVVWFAIRQNETLQSEKCIPFSLRHIITATIKILTNKIAVKYILALGLVTSSFLGYLNSSQGIFRELYQLGEQFPLYFAICALSLGSASFLNGKLVIKHGMRKLSKIAVTTQSVFAFVSLFVIYIYNGQPPLWMFMIYMLIILFSCGMLFGNLNALAMEPLGDVAGIGAAVVGSLSTFVSIPFGIVIGLSFSGTVYPLCIGFAVFSILTLVLLRWTDKQRDSATS